MLSCAEPEVANVSEGWEVNFAGAAGSRPFRLRDEGYRWDGRKARWRLRVLGLLVPVDRKRQQAPALVQIRRVHRAPGVVLGLDPEFLSLAHRAAN